MAAAVVANDLRDPVLSYVSLYSSRRRTPGYMWLERFRSQSSSSGPRTASRCTS